MRAEPRCFSHDLEAELAPGQRSQLDAEEAPKLLDVRLLRIHAQRARPGLGERLDEALELGAEEPAHALEKGRRKPHAVPGTAAAGARSSRVSTRIATTRSTTSAPV